MGNQISCFGGCFGVEPGARARAEMPGPHGDVHHPDDSLSDLNELVMAETQPSSYRQNDLSKVVRDMQMIYQEAEEQAKLQYVTPEEIQATASISQASAEKRTSGRSA